MARTRIDCDSISSRCCVYPTRGPGGLGYYLYRRYDHRAIGRVLSRPGTPGHWCAELFVDRAYVPLGKFGRVDAGLVQAIRCIERSAGRLLL